MEAKRPLLISFTVVVDISPATICLCKARKEPHTQAAQRTACKEAQAVQVSRSKAYMEFQVLAVWRRRSLLAARGAPVAARRTHLRR